MSNKNIDRETTNNIMNKLDKIRDELEQISDEEAIAFALETLKKRKRIHLT